MRHLAAFLEEHGDEAYTLAELWVQEFGEETPPPAVPAGTALRHGGWADDSRASETLMYAGHEVQVWEDPRLPLVARRFVYALAKLVEHKVVEERLLAGAPYYSKGSVPLIQLLNA